MKVGDIFKIDLMRNNQEVVYEVLTISSDEEWVAAKVIHPQHLSEKLNSEGIFKIFVAGLKIEVLGNIKDEMIKAVYV